MHRLLPFERAAMVLALVWLVIALCWSQLYTALWIGAIALHLIVFFLLALLGVFGIGVAIKDGGPLRRIVRGAVGTPAIIFAALLLHAPVQWAGFWLHGQWLLMRYGDDYATEIARAGGGAMAFPILLGVPDGGIALIYAPHGVPTRWADRQAMAVVGERIHQCLRLRRRYHVCAYD